MARRTIYVPDDVDKEVEQLKERINVSEVCVKALRGEMSRLKMMEASPMAIDLDKLTERLKAQRQNSLERCAEAGKKAAAEWLSEAAYDEIRGMGNSVRNQVKLGSDGKAVPTGTLSGELPTLETHRMRQFMATLEDEELRPESGAYEKAWLRQVSEVWAAIKDRI